MKLGIVMDPIGSINFIKDSSLAILLEAQSRNYDILYMEPTSLFLKETRAYALAHELTVKNNPEEWFVLSSNKTICLSDLDIILMRQDPPFNLHYIYNTYILEEAERDGVLVVNKPSSLRDCNEKIFISQFPECCPNFLVTSEKSLLYEFVMKYEDAVIKPLDGMGGSSIFRVKKNDPNIYVIFETITNLFSTKVMIQEFIPQITEGDKRILLVNGRPLGGLISRIPAKGEFRGNLAAGASAIAKSLTSRDEWICEQVGPRLRELGLLLVGLDIIGEYLTEINVTSPTCFKEYLNLSNIDVASIFINQLESMLDR